jgi:hypothetical protein
MGCLEVRPTSKTESLAARSTYRPFHLPFGPFLPPSLLFLLSSALPLFSWTFDAALRWRSPQRLLWASMSQVNLPSLSP